MAIKSLKPYALLVTLLSWLSGCDDRNFDRVLDAFVDGRCEEGKQRAEEWVRVNFGTHEKMCETLQDKGYIDIWDYISRNAGATGIAKANKAERQCGSLPELTSCPNNQRGVPTKGRRSPN